MALKLISPPDIEPVSLAEIKVFARIGTGTTEDAMIESLIIAARQEAEKITRRQLITATWELRLDSFPSGTIYLGMPPLQSVTSVKYLSEANVETTLVLNTDYEIDTYSEPARINPSYGTTWPATYSVPNAVRIVYKAGYGEDAVDVPDSIRNWIKLMVGSMYEHRELDIVSNVTQAYTRLKFLDCLLDNFRVFGME